MNGETRMRLTVAIAFLLVAAAAVFAIGAAVERSQLTDAETTVTAGNGPEGSAEGEAAEHASTAGAATGGASVHSDSERFLGVNTESTGLVIIAVVASVLLAAAVIGVRRTWVLGAAALVALAAAAFDIREIVHQIDESRDTVAALASVTAVLHLTAAALAAFGLWSVTRIRDVAVQPA